MSDAAPFLRPAFAVGFGVAGHVESERPERTSASPAAEQMNVAPWTVDDISSSNLRCKIDG